MTGCILSMHCGRFACRSQRLFLFSLLALALSAGCGESRRPLQKGVADQPAERSGNQDKLNDSAGQAQMDSSFKSPVSIDDAPQSTVLTADKPILSQTDEPKPAVLLPPEVEGLQRIEPQADVWVDKKNRRVVLVGEVCRREGQLEMFACLKNSKEHESIVAVRTKAFFVAAALLALGAEQGRPVQFRPEFKPATGPEVEVAVRWTDEQGKRQQTRAQEWIRHVKTGKSLAHNWVFGGSGFWLNENTGEQHFMAEDGDLICISNFTTALLDLPIESTQASSSLEFEAFTERIPPVKTQVVLYLTPKLKEKPAEENKQPEKP